MTDVCNLSRGQQGKQSRFLKLAVTVISKQRSFVALKQTGVLHKVAPRGGS